MSIKPNTDLSGDWNVRGPDIETCLISGVHAELMDAARLARIEFNNGFPNWELYRCALAGDSLHLSKLRKWVVAFTVAYCMDGGIKRSAYTEELAATAAWDALHMVMYSKPLDDYTTLANSLGTDKKTYRRLRDAIFLRLKASLDTYWLNLISAYTQVLIYERKSLVPKRGVI